MKSKFLLSVIIPVFNEEENIEPLLNALLPIVGSYDYELLFIDDGSSDNTVSEIRSLALKNTKIKNIKARTMNMAICSYFFKAFSPI